MKEGAKVFFKYTIRFPHPHKSDQRIHYFQCTLINFQLYHHMIVFRNYPSNKRLSFPINNRSVEHARDGNINGHDARALWKNSLWKPKKSMDFNIITILPSVLLVVNSSVAIGTMPSPSVFVHIVSCKQNQYEINEVSSFIF